MKNNTPPGPRSGGKWRPGWPAIWWGTATLTILVALFLPDPANFVIGFWLCVFMVVSFIVQKKKLVMAREITGELIALSRLGVPPSEALERIKAYHPAEGRKIGLILGDLTNGQALATTLERRLRWPAELIKAWAAGEAVGDPAGLLSDYWRFRQTKIEEYTELGRAVAYPLAILTVLLLVGTMVLALVAPTYQRMFADFGKVLPVPTQVVIEISGLIGQAAGPVALIVLAGLAFHLVLRLLTGRGLWPAWHSSMDSLGLLIFARSAMARGIGLAQALETAATISGIRRYRRAARNLIRRARNGQPLDEGLTRDWPPDLVAALQTAGTATDPLAALGLFEEAFREGMWAKFRVFYRRLGIGLLLLVYLLSALLIVSMYLPIFNLATPVLGQ